MITLKTIDSSFLAFIVLVLIYINAYNRWGEVFVPYKLFMLLLKINMILIVIDILGWVFNGLPGDLNMLANQGFNLLLYIMEPVGAGIWILYADFQLFHDEKRIRKFKKVLIFLLTINAVLSIMSLRTGWFFSVDMDNIYYRGDFFWLHTAFCYALIGYSFFLIVIKRRLIEKRYYYSLLLFFIPQVIGTLIQTVSYGVSYNWSGMMLSLLIIYFNIQDQGLNTDYLTGIYNRRQLDNYIKMKIQNSTEKKTFSAILIDLNKFKQINDKFGHDVGDEALQDAVSVIKSCLSRNDLLARFGGDEFFVISENDTHLLIEEIVGKILKKIELFNKINHKPYQLGVSMGYDVYDYKLKMSQDEFLKHIDILMYNNKKSTQATC